MSEPPRRSTNDVPGRVLHPPHRHAAPCAPWPWMDIDDVVTSGQLNAFPERTVCDHNIETCNNCWRKYPQSLFPNWTPRQVTRSGIEKAIKGYKKDLDCVLYQMDVDDAGKFDTTNKVIKSNRGDDDKTWNQLLNAVKTKELRVRAFFIENMSGPILQMLGTLYNIEPFFWSSPLNWIPSRFQEEIIPDVGDHITITLTFLRSTRAQAGKPMETIKHPLALRGLQRIDTNAPLELDSNDRTLVLDTLAVHLIRNNQKGNAIISYHPRLNSSTTEASFLYDRIRLAGQSVYWQRIFRDRKDPTFILLAFIWHAMYAWDEALENLYQHICALENRVIETSEMTLTQELHYIRAHVLHYTSLLEDYAKHVNFIRDAPNPAASSMTSKEREYSKMEMARECTNLVTEIKRLTATLAMQERRVKNVMGLLISSVNIKMTEAAVRDSAAMKQIAYLTMFFLPASFVAGIFGMNIKEINPGTLGSITHYFEVAVPLTLTTAWVIIAFQSTYIFKKETSFWKRLGWPLYLIHMMIVKRQKHVLPVSSSDIRPPKRKPSFEDYDVPLKAM